MRMPWGKHRGVDLEDIEASYLWWVLEHANNLQPDLALEIRSELLSRLGDSVDDAPPPPPPRGADRCPDPKLARQVVTSGWRALSKQHHPDHGGDTATMQRLNATVEWLKLQVVS
jgi:hypothetical protein